MYFCLIVRYFYLLVFCTPFFSGSPGSKSVKSLSSVSSWSTTMTASASAGGSRSWLSSLSLSSRKRHKSGAARKLFETTSTKEAKKREEER